MKLWIKLLVATIAIISCFVVVLAARVDSKLDFGEVAARVEEQKESRENLPSPNVRNVRVTVETKNEKGSPESKSSESSESSSSGDRTSSGSIGVRTDVTFEISNETNETRSQEDNNNKKKSKGNKKKNGEDEDDDDIPVIKGRTTPPKKKVDVTTWRPKVRPIFPKSESDETVRSRAGPPPNVPWTKTFPGNAMWTTERNYFGLFDNYDNFHPSQPVGTSSFQPSHRSSHNPQVQFHPYPTWQNCRCDLLRPELNAWSPSGESQSANHRNQYHYTVVDDKLEEPFSVKDRPHNKKRRESRES